ncbi:MAG: VWA domain-containing protein [Sedimentisphaerales bacterium]|nr:VWA domain-containing protein [Sedimentisphaerales bacterium]
MYNYGFYFGQPWWLLGCILLVPIIWLARRNLTSLSPLRRWCAIILRCIVVLFLVLLLARPALTRKSKHLTVIIVLDRSQSISQELQDQSLEYLSQALGDKIAPDQVAVIDVAETACISKLPSTNSGVRQRNTTLTGGQTKLDAGIEMALAIAPPNTAVRILLISEGNETAGDLRQAAQTAAANNIPIDILPIQYQYKSEVVFKRLVAPSRARSSQTVPLRFILSSTSAAKGKLQLNLNDKQIDLAPDSDDVTVPVELVPGTNVQTVSVPVGSGGIHEFEAIFIPDDESQDKVSQNNVASAITHVTGPGHVLIVDSDGLSGQTMVKALAESNIDVRYIMAAEFPDNLARLMDTDAVILVNTDCSNFSFAQQDMICSYVNDLGGGLVMTGGPSSFGAGGWIGSPVADILPVDLDPPQRKDLPKGALVLVMHACEMPQGNYWGKMVASSAVDALSRLDLVGILAYNWQGAGIDNWVFPLSEVGDKQEVKSAINIMQMGDMMSIHAHMQEAYNELKKCDASQKHVIIITDGDPQPPSDDLLKAYVESGITCTTVAIFPHNNNPYDLQKLRRIADFTGGRMYDVTTPSQLPQIFIKEAQVVRRSLINEQTFTPQLVYSLSEITKGLSAGFPDLDGYVITGPKGGLNQVILNSQESDPVLAICQSGLGRCAAFTSSIDSRWATNWLGWSNFETFWEQVVRWAGKPAQSPDCEVTADVQDKQVTVNVEAVDDEGKFIQFSDIDGQVISPDVDIEHLELVQVGPGQYSGKFEAKGSGSYIVNLRYKKIGEPDKTYVTDTAVTIPFAPEFRDLSDNMPLLTQVSELTDGRILSTDPNQANLFDYSGLKFPETQLPMIRPLMLIWLALFLLDVAVRRLALDFKAMSRRAVHFIMLKRERKADPTLEKLKLKRKQVQDQFKSRSEEAAASRRYTADEKFKGDLPVSQIQDKKPPEPAARKEEPKKAPQEEVTHIQRLLKAKRKSGESRKENENE